MHFYHKSKKNSNEYIYNLSMFSRVRKLSASKRIEHNHKNDYLSDRLNAQRLLALISLLVPLGLFGLYIFTPHTSDSGSESILIYISLIVIAIASFRLVYNWKKPRNNLYQLTCALLDFLAIAAILVGYTFTYEVPISVALKSPTANIFFVYLTSRIVLFHGQILVKTCIMALGIWIALVSLSIFEPQYEGRTSSYVEYLTGFKVLIGAEIERMLQFTIITAVLYTFIYVSRRDPVTGFLRRPYFLQNVAKSLVHLRRKDTGNIYALIELRIPDLTITNRIHDTIFMLVPDLLTLKTVNVVNIGRLSNRNIAIWINYSNNKVKLEALTADISAELTDMATSKLGSDIPLIVIGGVRFNINVSSQEHLTYTDIAIREALREGKKALIFDEKIETKILHKQYVEQAIEFGLNRQSFYVHYQPIVDLMTDKPVGFEALIRLNDKNGETIRPDIFIPIAEAAGLISDITDHLCNMVSEDAKYLKDIYFTQDRKPYININISPQQLNDIDRTLSALRRARNGGLDINVEITESGTLNEVNALSKIEMINQSGFSVAIDDFGTGYASIERLSRLNVATLKVDRCFIENIEDAKSYSFLEAIVKLARTTSDYVIIEGVSTLSQKLLLMKMGVRLCQGYFFAHPMGIASLEEYLAENYDIRRPSQRRIGHVASF